MNTLERLFRTTQYLRDTSTRIFVTSTGAGAGVQKLLWDVPGISSVLVGCHFPYATEATEAFLGFKPEKFCSAETAIDLAHSSYMQAWVPGSDAIGVGLTASVASTKAHRGDHRVYVATVSSKNTWVTGVTLPKGLGERREQDGRIADYLAMACLFRAVGFNPEDAWHALYDAAGGEDNFTIVEDMIADELSFTQFFKHPFFGEHGDRASAPEPGQALDLFPGAFNPPHEGHFGIAQTAARAFPSNPIFEVTVDSPHKPRLTVADMLQRAKLLRGKNRLFTTGAALFIEKAKRYPGSNLVVGIDALVRIFDKRWCDNPNALAAEFAATKVHFWVFGREVDGEFLTLTDAVSKGMLPMRLRASALGGRWDVSSSAIRKAS